MVLILFTIYHLVLYTVTCLNILTYYRIILLTNFNVQFFIH